MLKNWGFSDYGRDDLQVTLNATRVGASAPTWALVRQDVTGTSPGVYAWAFSKLTENIVWFEAQIPHSWQTGSIAYPHVHWCGPINGGAGHFVKWDFEYTIADIGGVIPVTSLDSSSINYPEGDIVAYRHYVTRFSGIDLSAITGPSAMFLCRLSRDGAADDYDDVAFGLSCDFHIIKHRMGDGPSDH